MPSIHLRLSEELHEKLRENAFSARRSLNAEIIQALEAYANQGEPAAELAARLRAENVLAEAVEADAEKLPPLWDDVKAVAQALHGALWAYMADAPPTSLPALPTREDSPVWAADASALLAAYSSGVPGHVEWREALTGGPHPTVVDIETPATVRNAIRLAARERRRNKAKVEPLVALVEADVATQYVLTTATDADAAVAEEYEHLYGIGIRQPGALARVAAVKAAVDPHRAWAYLTLDPIAAAEAEKLGFVVAK